MINQTIAVMNGKSGVGKTSLVANLAGLAAASGWRVLIVDLDQQGHLGNLLTYQDRSDRGAGLAAAARSGEALNVVHDVRPGLDVVAGGEALRNLANELIRQTAIGAVPDHHSATWLSSALSPLAENYDLILLDTPPSGSTVHLAAVTAARYVVVPTAPDHDSIEGLAEVATLFADVLSSWNPDIELLGVVLTQLVRGASAIERRARQELSEILADGLPIFASTIRFAPHAAQQFSQFGLLAHEYEQDAGDAEEAEAEPRRRCGVGGGLPGDHQRSPAGLHGSAGSCTGVHHGLAPAQGGARPRKRSPTEARCRACAWEGPRAWTPAS